LKKAGVPEAKDPRERRAETTRLKIIAAANALVTELGVEGLTMRALAGRVDYSPTALYKYFKDKDELISAMREESWKSMNDFASSSPMKAPDLLAALVESGMRMYAFARENPGHYLSMMSPGKGFPASMEEFFGHSNFTGLIRLVSEGASRGDIALPAGVDARTISVFCFVVIHGASMLRMGLFKEHPAEWDVLAESVIALAAKMFSPRR
jgi:AcrR family transcriptional regulator